MRGSVGPASTTLDAVWYEVSLAPAGASSETRQRERDDLDGPCHVLGRHARDSRKVEYRW